MTRGRAHRPSPAPPAPRQGARGLRRRRRPLLLVATDRVSAFDVVMREPIPHKGAVLTQITAWWLRQFESLVHHHMLSADIDEIIDDGARRSPIIARRSPAARCCAGAPRSFRSSASCAATSRARRGRSTARTARWPASRCRRACARASGSSPPIFSPATKAEDGTRREHHHRADGRRRSATTTATRARAAEPPRSTSAAATIAAERGIIIADTKFEFGRDRDGTITLIDEVLTPDSSRFWPADRYTPGTSQPSFDKQPLRDYLDGERRAGRWNGDAPPPPLPTGGRATRPARATSTRSAGSPARRSMTPRRLDVNFAREGLELHRHRGAHRGRRVRRGARCAARGRSGCSRSRWR